MLPQLLLHFRTGCCPRLLLLTYLHLRYQLTFSVSRGSPRLRNCTSTSFHHECLSTPRCLDSRLLCRSESLLHASPSTYYRHSLLLLPMLHVSFRDFVRRFRCLLVRTCISVRCVLWFAFGDPHTCVFLRLLCPQATVEAQPAPPVDVDGSPLPDSQYPQVELRTRCEVAQELIFGIVVSVPAVFPEACPGDEVSSALVVVSSPFCVWLPRHWNHRGAGRWISDLPSQISTDLSVPNLLSFASRVARQRSGITPGDR